MAAFAKVTHDPIFRPLVPFGIKMWLGAAVAAGSPLDGF
jgi:hypothetical protein